MSRTLEGNTVARLSRRRGQSSVSASVDRTSPARLDHHPDVLLLGAGKIGRMIATFLGKTGKYQVTVADADPSALLRFAAVNGLQTLPLDVSDRGQLAAAMED